MARTAAWRAAIAAAALVVLWRILAVNGLLVDERGRNRIPELPESEALRSLVRANPGEFTALLGLAARDEQAGRDREAATKLSAARALAPIARGTLERSAAFQLRSRDDAGATQSLDQLAEHYRAYDAAFPVLAQLLAARDPAWDAVVARNPPWIGDFIRTQCARSLDPALLVPLLLRRNASGQAQAAEAACVIEKLRAAGRWDLAYHVWLNTLPRDRLADVGHVFNGGFEHPATAVGFDWMPSQGGERTSGHAVEFAQTRGAGGKRALRVTYNGKRQAAPAMRQWLALAPGRYELAGRGRVDAQNSVRGVNWVVRCADAEAGPPLAASERFLGSSEWRDFTFEVEVPAGCRGQALQLEPVGLHDGTTFVSGTVWFDDLRLAQRR
jgi:hypothetical protein